MHITVGIYFLRLAYTAKTGSDTTRHTLFKGNVAENAILFRISFDRTEHCHWSARKDYLCIQRLLADRIHDIALCAHAAIFCCDI